MLSERELTKGGASVVDKVVKCDGEGGEKLTVDKVLLRETEVCTEKVGADSEAVSETKGKKVVDKAIDRE